MIDSSKIQSHLAPCLPWWIIVLVVVTRLELSGAEEYPRGPIPRAGLLFHASFDHGPQAEVGAGNREMHYRALIKGLPTWKFNFVDGRLGQALDLGAERRQSEYYRKNAIYTEAASFKFQGNFCMRSGTLSFWFRTTERPPSVKITTQTTDHWRTPPPLLEVSAKSGEALKAQLVDRTGRRFVAATLPKTDYADNRWHHLALAWDELEGVKAYLDGQQANGRAEAIPFHGGYLSVGQILLEDAQFDDLRIYDLPLSDRQIGILAAGEIPTLTSAPLSPAKAEHRLRHLSWADAPAENFIGLTGPTLIRRVDLADARALRMSGWRGVDGRDDSVWPMRYHGYEYLEGGGLHLKLGPNEGFNFVRLTGRLDHAELCAGGAWEKPAGTRSLVGFTGQRFASGQSLPERSTTSVVSVYPSKPKDYYRDENRELRDLALYDVRPGASPAGSLVYEAALSTADPTDIAGVNRVRLATWYRPDERDVVAASSAPAAGIKRLPALRFLHLMTSPQPRDLPVSALRMQMKVEGWKVDNTVNVRLHDPFNLWRTLVDVDLRLEREDELDVTLEFPAIILPAGTELCATIISRQEGSLRCGESQSRLQLFGPELAAAQQSYRQWQVHLLQDALAALSEPKPWVSNAADDNYLRVAFQSYDSIARILRDLYQRFPTDRLVRGCMLFTHPQDGAYWRALPIDLPRNPDVPRWALLQKELLGEFLHFAHWWIDERMVPNGELGSYYGDDTDLVQDWTSLAMIHDPDGKLRGSMRALADYTWNEKMHDGLNRLTRDALHAFEEGNNVQSPAALLDYGNPVLWERLLTTTRRYDGWLFTESRDGKRHSRGLDFGDTTVEGKPRNHFYEYLMLQAGMYLAWYNGSAPLTRILTECFDAQPDLRPRGTGLPHLLYLQTGDPRFIRAEKEPATDPWWVRMRNLKDCDPEVLQDLVRSRLGLSVAQKTGWSNYDPLKKYVAWHYTRDKNAMVPALEDAWKRMYYGMSMYTVMEQSGDRVAVHKNLTDFMYLGGMPAARNHLAPVFAVSYEGFSKELAGMVLDDTTENLRWVGFNFEPQTQQGLLRVWHLAPGLYEVRTGIDLDGNDTIDEGLETRRLELKRYEPIPLTLSSRKLQIVEARLVEKRTPLHQRCDLALTHEDATRKGNRLTVIVHNLGCVATGPFRVQLMRDGGEAIGAVSHAGLDGIGENLQARQAAIEFADVPPGMLRVSVSGIKEEITAANNQATIGAAPPR